MEAFLRRIDIIIREVETLVYSVEIIDNIRCEVIKFYKIRRLDFSSANAYIIAY